MNHISDWTLEQYVLGELSASDKIELLKRANADSVLEARISQIRRSNAVLLEEIPPDEFVKLIENSLEGNNSNTADQPNKKEIFIRRLKSLQQWCSTFSQRLYLGLTSFAVLLVVIMLVPNLNLISPKSVNTISENSVRLKGLQPQINVYRQTGTNAEKYSDKNVLQENDIIQISYVAAQNEYGYIFSIDGNDVITPHLKNNNLAAELESSGEITLENGYKLDDAPGFERFFFISAPKVFSVSQIDDAIHRLIKAKATRQGELAINLSPGQVFQVTSITFDKVNKD
jgi:hypothetical protein